jgi:hypothetical protein
MEAIKRVFSVSVFKGLRGVEVCLLLCFVLSSCSHYQLGTGRRALPGGHQKIDLPLFKNKSMEPGVEVDFTNALKQEFQRSGSAQIGTGNSSEVELQGIIESVNYTPGGLKTAEATSVMPMGSVIATTYTVQVKVKVSLVKKSDGQVLWTGGFSGERGYSAPQITVPGPNSANPNYNLSARRLHLGLVANDMMTEVHDRMTENF